MPLPRHRIAARRRTILLRADLSRDQVRRLITAPARRHGCLDDTLLSVASARAHERRTARTGGPV